MTLRVARLNARHLLLCRGDFHDAVLRLQACLDAFRASSLPMWSSTAAAMPGYARAMTERAEDGIPFLRGAIEQLRAAAPCKPSSRRISARRHLLARQPGEVAVLAERALALSWRCTARWA
jgi:hypothetical protein